MRSFDEIPIVESGRFRFPGRDCRTDRESLQFTLGIEENAGLGLLFKVRGTTKAPRDAVVISIDRESSEQLGIPDNPTNGPARCTHA